MYIEPKTNIKILKNVPLDTTYEHTIWFDDKTKQFNYFNGKVKYNLTNYSYQRVKRGTARVQINAENLYDCNYLMFQNTAFGNKWFYAYVTSVEYVNDVTSEISFELDVVQSWFFDYKLDYCFVEREITETDNMFEHYEPEGVDLGELVYNDYQPVRGLTDMAVIISVCDVNVSHGILPSENVVEGYVYDGVYGGATLYAFDTTVSNYETQINTFLENYASKPDAVINIYMCPKVFINNGTFVSGAKIGSTISGSEINTNMGTTTSDDTLHGYKPKNKKLYTYPYNFCNVSANGSSLSLRYEFFNSHNVTGRVFSTITAPVMCAFYPTQYKGTKSQTELSQAQPYLEESVQISQYPTCSWNTDSYRAFLAQNSVPLVLNSIASLTSSATGIANIANMPTAPEGIRYQIPPHDTLGRMYHQQRLDYAMTEMPQYKSQYLTNAVTNTGVQGVSNLFSTMYSASIQADIYKGKFSNAGVLNSNSMNTYWYGRMSITALYARSIDEFFSKYGYAIRRLKIPNTHSRPHWNYVKTVDCTISGSIPSDDMKAICNIYNRGITFWKNGNEVGNYSLDNTV